MTATPNRRWDVLLWWSAGGAAVGLTIYLFKNGMKVGVPAERSTWVMAIVSSVGGAVLLPVLWRFAQTMVETLRAQMEEVAIAFAKLLRAVRGGKGGQWQHYLSRKGADDWGRTVVWQTKDGEVLTTADAKVHERRMRERLVVGVMTRHLERSLTRSSLLLFLAMLLVGGYGLWTRDRAMLVVGAITCAFFVLAVVRQSILAWRAEHGYFGSSEHEVRELLAFAMRHPTPEDFFDDDGHVLPAFDLRPEEERGTAALGVPVPEGA